MISPHFALPTVPTPLRILDLTDISRMLEMIHNFYLDT